VHEAFLKLVNQSRVDWQSRTHFFCLAAQLMRRVLVDHARGAGRVRRGAGVPKISLDDGENHQRIGLSLRRMGLRAARTAAN
jgi:RNA polymerase sigma-70 factor (ECF subfamily)